MAGNLPVVLIRLNDRSPIAAGALPERATLPMQLGSLQKRVRTSRSSHITRVREGQ